ncbi:unnamed protein product [Discula destructiva]
MAAIASEYLADVLKPEQFAAAIFGVTLAFTIVSVNAVGLRVWSRLRSKQFGSDDYLMCTALAVNLVHNSIVMHGTFVGIGSPDSKLNPELEIEGRKHLFFWQIFYTLNLVFIKTSILTTLQKIDKERRFTYLVWGLIVVVSLLSVAGVITLLAKCRPIPANWTGADGGSCIASSVFVALSKTGYAFDVLSDVAMAVISTLLLWSPEMKMSAKVVTGAALGLGSVASVASVVRTVYTDAYGSEDNYLYSTGKIVLWTVVECGLGVIAGSLPMLKFARRVPRKEVYGKEMELQQSHYDFTRAMAEHGSRARR